MTLRRAIADAAAVLDQAGVASARTDAELLAAHLLGVERGRLSFAAVPDGFSTRYEEIISARAARIPVQHIIGTAAFGPVQLKVGPGVFIPRPETEALLEWALAQQLPDAPLLVDLCTGSGALAVALVAGRPDARVIAVDDDPTALEYARCNAAGTAVRVVAGDVTDSALLADLTGTVDMVVANPPYIPEGAQLEPEVALHDPAHALFGGADGMSVIGPIAARAVDWLKPGGLLAIEHDDTTSDATVRTVSATGRFEDVTARRDLAGRPRFVTARRAADADTAGRAPR